MRKINIEFSNPELNITPLVDVMLVLVVVLMLIIPALRYDEQINLPKGSQQHASAAKSQDIKIAIFPDHINFQGQKYSYTAFFDNLALAASSLDKSSSVFIAGDKSITYDVIMQVLAALKKLGFSKVSLQSK